MPRPTGSPITAATTLLALPLMVTALMLWPSAALPAAPDDGGAEPPNPAPAAPAPTVETVDGRTAIVHEGEASFYGPGFHGRKTASGDVFNQNDLTAASRELPLGTTAEVTNLETGKSVEVTVNDRGPYAEGRVIDLSKKAAEKLDMVEDGVAPVRVEQTPADQPTPKAQEKVEEKAREIQAEGGKRR